MKILDFKDNKVIVDPHTLTIHEFKVLWDRDKHEHKEQAFKELAFLYHYCNINSAYFDYPEDKKIESIATDVIRDPKWKLDKEIKAAIKKYEELAVTDEQRLLEAARHQMFEISKYFMTVKPDNDTKDTIVALFKSIVPTVTNFKKLKEMVETEEKSKSRLRGDKSVRMFER